MPEQLFLPPDFVSLFRTGRLTGQHLVSEIDPTHVVIVGADSIWCPLLFPQGLNIVFMLSSTWRRRRFCHATSAPSYRASIGRQSSLWRQTSASHAALSESKEYIQRPVRISGFLVDLQHGRTPGRVNSIPAAFEARISLDEYIRGQMETG